MAMKQHKLILLCRPARRRSTLKVLMASSALIAAGVIRRAKDGVRVLGNGKLKSKVSISAAAASGPAPNRSTWNLASHTYSVPSTNT